MKAYDAIVIGAGANGLVAATLLARAGVKTIVLERAERVGGCAITTEVAPGFRVPTLSHWAALDPALVRTLDLERHGLQILRGDAVGCIPTLDGRAVTLWNETARAAREIAAVSAADAARYPPFLASVAAVGGVLRRVISSPPPDIDRPSAGDLFELLKTARGFRALGRADAYRLLRWLPMPVIDFAGEWFESAPLTAAIAGAGVFGAFLGPRSAGSTANFLLLAARHEHPLAAGWSARGGTGALADALAAAARAAGVEIRSRAEIRQILVDDEEARGVVLDSGEEIRAGWVVSGVDPRRTLLELVDPIHLPPDFREAVRVIRARGTVAKINFAVSALPRFGGLERLDERSRAAALSGWIRLAPDVNAIERAFDAAKYGRLPEVPWIELAIPSLADEGLAPPGRHVVSACVQHVPFALHGTTWDRERDRLAGIVVATIEKFAPGFTRAVFAREVITPADLQTVYGLTGGHIFHGELALDQLFVARPLLGWARYHTPVRNLFLCGSGSHPGTGLDGRAGALAAREILRANGRRAGV